MQQPEAGRPAAGQLEDIRYLPRDAAVIETVARWHYAEWGRLTGRTVPMRIAELEPQAESRRIPLTVVAFLAGVPVGSASLLAEDMHTHSDLTPWLASVCVQSEYRRRGIGERLCRRIVAEARRLAVPRMYLFTVDQAPFYARMGWLTLGEETYRGETVTLMRLELD